MPDYFPEDYSFLSLYKNRRNPPPNFLHTMAYLVSLVRGPTDLEGDLKRARFVLAFLFDIEEQVDTPEILLVLQAELFPKNYRPQTPVMLSAVRWAPISALLEQNWTPQILARDSEKSSCASGIWKFGELKAAPPLEQCRTSEELFWHVVARVSAKARGTGQMLGLILQPGWMYESNLHRPQNLTQAEAERADRVIWQRTPRPTSEIWKPEDAGAA